MKNRYLRLYKKQKGFTLIELLAVILILGIIALIAIPTVTSVVEQSRKGSSENTGMQIVNSTEQYYISCELNGGVDKNGNKCPDDLRGTLYTSAELADAIGVKGDFPNKEDLVVYKKNTDGTVALVYRKDTLACSNQVDESGNISYKYTGINNPNGVKCDKKKVSNGGAVLLQTNGTKHVLKAFSSEEQYQNDKFSYNHTEFHDAKYEEYIYSVSFVNYDTVPENAVVSWDLSEAQDKSIIGWLTYVEGSDTYYDLYIGSKGDIYANPISYSFFSCLTAVTKYSFGNFYTNDMVEASNIFYKNFSLSHLDLSSWDVSNVINMLGLFNNVGRNANEFSIEGLENWDVSNVVNFKYMFRYTGFASSTTNIKDLSNWNTSSAIDMSYMFSFSGRHSSSWNVGDLSKWDVSNVTDMSYMFNCAGFNSLTWNVGDLSNWNTKNVTNMSDMFSNVGRTASSLYIGNIGIWDVSNVTDMSYMFDNAGYKANSFELDLSDWDTSNVINMEEMFSYAGYKANYKMDLSGWNVDKVINYSGFNGGVDSKVIAPVWKN